jgi:hypothetical protein
MSSSDDRVQQALAAHLEHAEVGGPEPDVSHLTDAERDELRELIALLDQTEGLGLHSTGGGRSAPTSSTAAGGRVLTTLRDILPSSTRVADDPAATTIGIDGMDVAEGWIVGTFGGRVRVWLLASEGALGNSDQWLRELERVFRLFPDTVGLTLVEPDLSCLLVQPEDCAPTIEVPHGSLVGRRYRRPVHALEEALSVFLRELIPSWEPLHDITSDASSVIDVASIAGERATVAIDEQIAAGARARKTNPKRSALAELGPQHAAALSDLVSRVHEGRFETDAIEDALRRLAGGIRESSRGEADR